ncbi:uncharacterized protein [Cicer arietinum]|uniref:uncharacterized protein n=1 Tax=Cicer arietinum TaxID=3827 RepID=UPI003CC5F2F8
MVMDRFHKANPPSFEGHYNPDGAQKWLQEVEKIFRGVACSEGQKVHLGTFMLTEEAEHWSDNARQRLDNAGTGNMLVPEYAAKFEELSRYYPLYVGEAGEKSKCIKFEMGLRPEIKKKGHMAYECRDAGVTCFNCQQQGHISTTCPYPRKTPQPRNQSSQASRPKSNGRVFALSGAGASEKDNLIQGTCLISDTPLFVLFDCGATHSFVSLDCVRRLGLPVSCLRYDLIVNTPTSDFVDTSSVCLDISIHVCGRDFRVDLVCLPLRLVDVILGMDWLSANCVRVETFSPKYSF